MPDKRSDQTPRQRSSRSRSPPHGPAPVRDRRERAQKGQQSFSKADQQQLRRLITAVGQNTDGVGKSMSDLSNIKPKFDGKGKLFPVIPDTEVFYRFNKKPGKEPDIMERVSKDSSASDFNWMARQDRFGKPNAFIGKTTTDDESLSALCNRVKQLCAEHNTPVASFRIELIPRFFVDKHRNEFEDIRANVQREQEPILIEDNEPAGEVAKAASSLDPVASSLVPDVVCGNKLCGRKGHTLAQCVVPDPKTGLVYGCPLCNDGDHLVDWSCPKMLQPAPGASEVDRAKMKEYIEMVLDIMFVKRANRPSFATNGLTWPLYFYSYRKHAKAIKSYAQLDGSVWDTKGRYPWTHEFAMGVVDTAEKMAKLKAFDPAKDCTCGPLNSNCTHFSPDPTYSKYKSLSETIQAFLDGKWTIATGHFPTAKSTHLFREGYLEARARELVASGEFRVKPEPDTERQVPPAPVKPESFPAPTIVHNASSKALYEWNEETDKFENTPNWEFLHFFTTADKARDLLRRCDPEADYAIDYAAWVFKHQPDFDQPVGDTVEDKALKAIITANEQLQQDVEEWAARGKASKAKDHATSPATTVGTLDASPKVTSGGNPTRSKQASRTQSLRRDLLAETRRREKAALTLQTRDKAPEVAPEIAPEEIGPEGVPLPSSSSEDEFFSESVEH